MNTPAEDEDQLQGWIVTLDELEASLAAFEAQLDSGDEVSEVERWSPPQAIGPLPGRLKARATALSWRMAAAEQRARDRQQALRRQLDDLTQRRAAGASYAAAGPEVTHTHDPYIIEPERP